MATPELTERLKAELAEELQQLDTRAAMIRDVLAGLSKLEDQARTAHVFVSLFAGTGRSRRGTGASPMRERILSIVKNASVPPTDEVILQRLGDQGPKSDTEKGRLKALQATLNRMVKGGQLVRRGDDTYVVAQQEQSPPESRASGPPMFGLPPDCDREEDEERF